MTESIGENSLAATDMVGATDESARTMPLIGGVVRPEGLPEAEEFGIVESASRKRVLTQGTMLILVVFVIAAGSLYGMRLTQRETAPSSTTKDAEVKIDQALAKLSSLNNTTTDESGDLNNLDKLFQDTEGIASWFAADPTDRQVPAQFVKKNPFVFPVFQSAPTPGADLDAEKDREKQDRVASLNRELSKLELQSIMQGPRPVAIISGQMLQPGQSVGSFKVKTVHDLWVELTSDGESFSLQMSNRQERNRRSSRSRAR